MKFSRKYPGARAASKVALSLKNWVRAWAWEGTNVVSNTNPAKILWQVAFIVCKLVMAFVNYHPHTEIHFSNSMQISFTASGSM